MNLCSVPARFERKFNIFAINDDNSFFGVHLKTAKVARMVPGAVVGNRWSRVSIVIPYLIVIYQSEL